MDYPVPSHETSKPRGRPLQGAQDTRQALIEVAKVLFSKYPYDKVTTRQLASDAGVNVGLIKYYFMNKEGLYKAMFRDFIEVVATGLKQQVDSEQFDGFESFFRLHANLMLKNPEFPILLQKEMMGEGKCQDYLAATVSQIIHPHFDRAVQQLKQKGLVAEQTDVKLIRLSVLSLTFFPFLSRSGLEKTEGITLDEENIEVIIKHNTRLIENGCFTKVR